MTDKQGAGDADRGDLRGNLQGDMRLAAKAFLVGWTRAQAILAGVEPPPKAGPMGIFLKMVAEESGTEEVGRRAEVITDALEETFEELRQKKAAESDAEEDDREDLEHAEEHTEEKPLPERLKIRERARGYDWWVRRAASSLEGYDVDTRLRGEDTLLERLRPGKVGALSRPRYEIEDPHELAHEIILALYRAAGRGRWRFQIKLEGWHPELEDDNERYTDQASSPLPPELGVAVFGEPQEEGYEHLAFENLYKLEDFACRDEGALRALHARIVSDVPGGVFDPERRMQLAKQARMILEVALEQIDHPQSVPPGMRGLGELAEMLDLEDESDDVYDAIEALHFDLEPIAAGEDLEEPLFEEEWGDGEER